MVAERVTAPAHRRRRRLPFPPTAAADAYRSRPPLPPIAAADASRPAHLRRRRDVYCSRPRHRQSSHPSLASKGAGSGTRLVSPVLQVYT